jgi:hypothetical protein
MKTMVAKIVLLCMFTVASSTVSAWDPVDLRVRDTRERSVTVQFHKKFKRGSTNYVRADRVNEIRFYPADEAVEFYVDNTMVVGAFSITDISLHKSRSGGFIFEMNDGNYANPTYYYAPYPEIVRPNGSGPYSEALMNFNAGYSYRIMLYRTIDDKKISACQPIEFEIEGRGPWVTEKGFDLNGDKTVSLIDKRIAYIPGLQRCTENMCTDLGFNPLVTESCP